MRHATRGAKDPVATERLVHYLHLTFPDIPVNKALRVKCRSPDCGVRASRGRIPGFGDADVSRTPVQPDDFPRSGTATRSIKPGRVTARNGRGPDGPRPSIRRRRGVTSIPQPAFVNRPPDIVRLAAPAPAPRKRRSFLPRPRGATDAAPGRAKRARGSPGSRVVSRHGD